MADYLLKESTNGAGYTVRLYLTLSYTQSIEKNQSYLTVGMKVSVSGGHIGKWVDGDGSSYIQIGEGNNNKRKFNGTIPYTSGCTITSGHSFTVDHESSGAKTVEIKWKWNVNSSWGGMVRPEGTLEVTLNTILRASDFSISDQLKLGDKHKVMLTVSKSVPDFKHKIFFKVYKGATGAELASDESVVFSESTRLTYPTARFANHMTGTSLKGKAILYTYASDGTTYIDSRSKDVTFLIPNEEPFTPEISELSVASEQDAKIPASWTDKDGRKIFVQGVSTVKLIAGKVKPKYSASIQKVTFDSKEGSKVTAAEYVSSTFSIKNYSKSGNQSVSVRATDSRGNYTDQKLEFYVYPYQKPTVNVLCCERCRADGTASDSGTCLKVRARCSFSSVGARNSASIKVEFRKVGESSWTAYEDELNPDTDIVIGEDAFSTMSSYEVRFIATDLLGGTGERTVRIPTQSVVMNVRPGGNGVAFGKYAEEENLMDIKFPVRTSSDVDVGGELLMGGVPLVESVISKDPKEWSYRKWADGTAECWKILGEVTLYDIDGEWEYSGTWFKIIHEKEPYPAGLFKSRPACVVNCPADNFPGWIKEVGASNNITTAPTICAHTVVKRTGTNIKFYPSYYAIGRWEKEEQTTQQQSGGNQDGNL